MAIFGMIAVRQFGYVKRPWWYIALHVAVLAIASGMTVMVLYDEITWAYVFYGIVVAIMGLLISTDWAVFTVVNLVIIAAIATRGFTQPFSHTPVATSISVPGTTALILAYKRCTQRTVRL